MDERTVVPRHRSDGRNVLESAWSQLAIALLLAIVIVRTAGPRLRDLLGLDRVDVGTSQIGLDDVLFSLVPAEAGVTAWTLGQFAEYEWHASGSTKSDAARRRMRVEVLRRLAPSDARAVEFGMPLEGMHWLRLRALRHFRTEPIDVYRLAAPRSLLISDGTPSFAFIEGYFAVQSRPSRREWSERLEFVDVGTEIVVGGQGALPCRKLEWRERGGNGTALAEVWTSPRAAPLGVVRVRTASGALELVQVGQREPEPLSAAIAPLVEGRSTMSRACHSCHGTDGRAGPEFAQPIDAESPVLDLTDDLYHRLKAGLFVPQCEPLLLRTSQLGGPSEGQPAPGEYLTFAREGGTFAVRSDRRGAVVAHLDREAALSHMTVTTRPDCGLAREFEERPRHPLR